MNTTPNHGVLLLVEDDENDAFFFLRAFKKAGFENTVHVAKDGVEAVQYLAGEGEFKDRARFPVPVFVVLDLNLPRRPGMEVLRWIRRDSGCRDLIVIVLTSSTSELDLVAAYEAGANSYLLKPVATDQMLRLVQLIGTYWIRENRFPPRPAPPAAQPSAMQAATASLPAR